MGPRTDVGETAVEQAGGLLEECAEGDCNGGMEEEEGPPPYHEGEQQGERGYDEEVGDEEVEGEGAEVVEREGEGAELGDKGDAGNAEGVADYPGEAAAGEELLDVGACGEDGGHGHIGELEAYIEEVEGTHEEHAEGGEGEHVQGGAVAADPAGYDVEGAHEDGSHHGGGHAHEEGKEPQEGDGGELGQRMQTPAVTEAAEGKGEQTVEDAYVETGEGEGVGGAGMGVDGTDVGTELLLVAEGEGGKDAEFVAPEDGEETGVETVVQTSHALAYSEVGFVPYGDGLHGGNVGGATDALEHEIAGVVEIVVGGEIGDWLHAAVDVDDIARLQGRGD